MVTFPKRKSPKEQGHGAIIRQKLFLMQLWIFNDKFVLIKRIVKLNARYGRVYYLASVPARLDPGTPFTSSIEATAV